MLQALGEFWMDYGVIIMAVSAAITLLGAVFTLFKNNSISTKAVDRTQQAEQFLSAEHKALSTEQEIAKYRAEQISREIGKVSDTVGSVYKTQMDDRYERKVQYDTLSDAHKHLVASAKEIGSFSEEFSRLASENAELHTQVEKLLAKCEHLEAQLERTQKLQTTPQHFHEHDLGIDR